MLRNYRATQHTSTNFSPYELPFNKTMRIRLPELESIKKIPLFPEGIKKINK